METVGLPEEQVLSTCPKSAHSPKENADLRRKRRFSTSFLRKQESSRTLDPCFRRGDGGWDHTGIQQACRRTRKRRSSTSFRASRNPAGLWTPALAGETRAGVTQESCRPVGARGNGVLQLRKQESSRTLDPCFRRDGGQGSQTTRLTKSICAGRITCDCPGPGMLRHPRTNKRRRASPLRAVTGVRCDICLPPPPAGALTPVRRTPASIPHVAAPRGKLPTA